MGHTSVSVGVAGRFYRGNLHSETHGLHQGYPGINHDFFVENAQMGIAFLAAGPSDVTVTTLDGASQHREPHPTARSHEASSMSLSIVIV